MVPDQYVQGEDLVRTAPELLQTIENYIQQQALATKVVSTAYALFGGREALSADQMESRILEWGMLSCADDPGE
jgi:hypothetical protein